MHVYIGLSVIVEVYVSLTDTRYLQSLILWYVFLCFYCSGCTNRADFRGI